jgi:hypothetical protein
MSIKRLWPLFVCLLFLPGLLLAAEQSASNSLPTSKNPSQGFWKKMHLGANPKTIEAARSQCDRFADMTLDDNFTLVHCVVLQEKLTNGQCKEVVVGDEDNVTHDFLGGRNNSTARNTTKLTGTNDPALLCDMNDGLYAYWYMQSSEESCNNLGISIAEVPRIVTQIPLEKEYVEVKVCDKFPVLNPGPPGYEWSYSAQILPYCLNRSLLVSGGVTRYESPMGFGVIESNCRIEIREVQQ